jgi:hypothetical protein
MAVRLKMPVRIVNSKQNARLKELRRALSRPGRDAGTLAGIEGPNLLEEALRAGLRVPWVFVAADAEHVLGGLPLGAETEVVLVPRELLTPALSTETPQPVAALVEPPEWTWIHVLGNRKTAPLVVILAGVQDPGPGPSALGRRLRSPRRDQPARNRKRLEPEGASGVGGERLSAAANLGRRRGVLSHAAGGRGEGVHDGTARSDGGR